jgi:hypothetical protein
MAHKALATAGRTAAGAAGAGSSAVEAFSQPRVGRGRANADGPGRERIVSSAGPRPDRSRPGRRVLSRWRPSCRPRRGSQGSGDGGNFGRAADLGELRDDRAGRVGAQEKGAQVPPESGRGREAVERGDRPQDVYAGVEGRHDAGNGTVVAQGEQRAHGQLMRPVRYGLSAVQAAGPAGRPARLAGRFGDSAAVADRRGQGCHLGEHVGIGREAGDVDQGRQPGRRISAGQGFQPVEDRSAAFGLHHRDITAPSPRHHRDSGRGAGNEEASRGRQGGDGRVMDGPLVRQRGTDAVGGGAGVGRARLREQGGPRRWPGRRRAGGTTMRAWRASCRTAPTSRRRAEAEGQRPKDKGRRTKAEGQRPKDKGRRTKAEGQRPKDKGPKTRKQGRRTNGGTAECGRPRSHRQPREGGSGHGWAGRSRASSSAATVKAMDHQKAMSKADVNDCEDA